MKKIIVIGCPGSGKSTFSRKLSSKLGIPLYHLDLIFHKPDKTMYTDLEFDEKLQQLMESESWILDGNYIRTLSKRLDQCDTVFWLNYPLELCLKGIESRRGKPRTDMPWIEMEPDEEFLEFVKNFETDQIPQIKRQLEDRKEKEIYIFSSREDATNYLNGGSEDGV